MEILIVDDEPTMQEILWEVARKAFPGCHPVTVGDLEAALARLAHQKAPDLVLLDLLLPGHKGLDALKRVRWKFPGIPVVVSAIEDPKAVRAALDAGAAGFIHKSTPPAEMIAVVKSALKA
jgi:DNA-binding NarL/FixJ family response regulator